MWKIFGRSPKFSPASASSFTDELVQPLPQEFAAEELKFHSFEKPPVEKVIACIVTHGMGQQVPFETVGQIAESLVAGIPNVPVEVNRVRLTSSEDLISRIEIYLKGSEGRPNIRLHLYEGYWAPLTEGKVTFYESCRFLFSGAWSGLKSCLAGKRFSRWVFGEMREFPIKPGTFKDLLIMVLFLVLGSVLGYLLEVRLQHAYSGVKDWMPAHPYLFSYLLHVLKGLVVALMHWLSLVFHHPIKALSSVWFTVLFLVGGVWHRAWSIFVLVLAGLYIYYLHYFMVEFVGDVAIYVSSYKVSKFQEVRTAIQKTIFNLASQVYSATKDVAGNKIYDRIFLVGHSLGSVISYDLLNELIVWDQRCCAGNQRVVARTSRLITFGSPLDKTAFLFRSQVSQNHHYREALAALQQPLVLDYALRPIQSFKWVNIFAWADVVSGSLIYYDSPDNTKGSQAPVNRVQNRRAPEAWVPIVAHVQYWNGETLRSELLKAILES